MFPYIYMPAGCWFLAMLGFVVFTLFACFLLRRIFRGGGFCCAGQRKADWMNRHAR